MRSHYCGLINDSLIDQTINALRLGGSTGVTHGGVIFLDLRDREGVVQVVFDPGHRGALSACRQRSQ